MNFLFVSLGGAFGALLRYTTALCVEKIDPSFFPWSILLVNTLGSFGVGILTSLSLSQNFESFFIIGFLGALTTFSSFAYKSIVLLKSETYFLFFLHIVLNNVLCLLAIFLAQYCMKNVNL